MTSKIKFAKIEFFETQVSWEGRKFEPDKNIPIKAIEYWNGRSNKKGWAIYLNISRLSKAALSEIRTNRKLIEDVYFIGQDLVQARAYIKYLALKYPELIDATINIKEKKRILEKITVLKNEFHEIDVDWCGKKFKSVKRIPLKAIEYWNGRSSKKGWVIYVNTYNLTNETINVLKKHETYIADVFKMGESKVESFRNIENIIKLCPELIQESSERSCINKTDFFFGIAKVFKAAYDSGHTALIDRKAFDMVDDLISVNSPFENCRREHIVPCKVLLDEVLNIYANNGSIIKVKEMLEENLKLLHITKHQQRILDTKYKQTMPNGWSFGDSPYARLDKLEIPYYK